MYVNVHAWYLQAETADEIDAIWDMKVKVMVPPKRFYSSVQKFVPRWTTCASWARTGTRPCLSRRGRVSPFVPLSPGMPWRRRLKRSTISTLPGRTTGRNIPFKQMPPVVLLLAKLTQPHHVGHRSRDGWRHRRRSSNFPGCMWGCCGTCCGTCSGWQWIGLNF